MNQTFHNPEGNPGFPLIRADQAELPEFIGQAAMAPEIAPALHAERLQTVYEHYGFYPHNKRELSEAYNLVSFRQQPSGVAKHLNEVLLHQQRARTDDPHAALRSIVQRYEARREEAVKDGYFSRDFIENTGQKGDRGFDLAAYIERYGVEFGYRELGQIARFVDARMIAKGCAVETTRFGENYGATPKGRQYVAEVLSTLNQSQVANVALDVHRANVQRAAFWGDTLVEARKHYAVRSQVAELIARA